MKIKIEAQAQSTKEKRYLLDCSEEEVKALRAVLGRIAGEAPIRRILTSIFKILSAYFPDYTGYKYFKNDLEVRPDVEP